MIKSRATTEESFLDLVDTLGRGGTEDWKDLYGRAQKNGELRKKIRKALLMVDPDLGSTKALWDWLLDQLEKGVDREDINWEGRQAGRVRG